MLDLKEPTVQPDRRRVSILVPMCNEQDSLGNLKVKLERLQARIGQDFAVQYCFINDGSTDGTRESMHLAAPEGVEFQALSHPVNLGLGAAIRTGIRHVSADIVCTIDADCSYAPEELSALIALVESGEADIAVASPYHPQGSVVGVQPWRLFLSMQCSRLYRWVSPVKLHTYTSIFRAYRGDMVGDMEFASDGFVSAVEILLSAHRLGCRIGEVPVVLHARAHGYSKMRIARTILTHLSVLFNCAKATLRGKAPRLGPKCTGSAQESLPLMMSFAAPEKSESLRREQV